MADTITVKPKAMNRANFIKKYGDIMDKLIERISWETSAREEGAGGMPLEIPNPVIRTVCFNHTIEESTIAFAKSLGIEAKNVPSRDGQINGVVEFSIPMSVLRAAVIPPLSRDQENQAISNRLACIEEENLIQEASDRKNNEGAWSY